MNYYPHHIGDFNHATRHLTRVERSLYRDMIEMYYDTETPLPANDFDALCKRLLAKTVEEKEAVSAVLAEFFTRDGDVWRNARCDAEIVVYKAKLETASKAGKASGESRRRNHRESVKRALNRRLTTVERPLNERGANQNHNQEYKTPLPPSGAFLRFWNAWPKSKRKQAQGKCQELWQRRDFDQVAPAILAHVESLKSSTDWLKDGGEFVPSPLVYLNQRRWEGAETSEEPQSLRVAMP